MNSLITITHDVNNFKNQVLGFRNLCTTDQENSNILKGFLKNAPKYAIISNFDSINAYKDEQHLNKFQSTWTIEKFKSNEASMETVYQNLLVKWHTLNKMWIDEFGYSPQSDVMIREIFNICIDSAKTLSYTTNNIFHIAGVMHLLDRNLLKNMFKKKEMTEYLEFFLLGANKYNTRKNLENSFIELKVKMFDLLDRMKNDYDSAKNNLHIQNQQYAVNSGRVRAITEGLIAQAEAGAHVEAELHKQRQELMSYENQEFDDLLLKINKYL
jgi:hypothetical protein